MTQDANGPRYTPWKDIAADWYEGFKRGDKPITYDCGFNLEIGPGSLTLIGGGPGSGKTQFALQLITTALLKDESLRCIYCSIEVPGNELVVRQAAMECRVSYDDLRKNNPLVEREREALDAWHKLVVEDIGERLVLLDRPHDMDNIGFCLDVLESEIVVLDYIQRIPSTRGETLEPRLQINSVLDRARHWCDLGTAVIAISSLNRAGKSGYGDAGITSFRESGELEFGADEAYLLVRDKDDITLKQVKARYRKSEDIPLRQNDSLRFTAGQHDFAEYTA